MLLPSLTFAPTTIDLRKINISINYIGLSHNQPLWSLIRFSVCQQCEPLPRWTSPSKKHLHLHDGTLLLYLMATTSTLMLFSVYNLHKRQCREAMSLPHSHPSTIVSSSDIGVVDCIVRAVCSCCIMQFLAFFSLNAVASSCCVTSEAIGNCNAISYMIKEKTANWATPLEQAYMNCESKTGTIDPAQQPTTNVKLAI